MNHKLFRNESIGRVSSPEQLNDYIRVSNPSAWVVLFAVLGVLVAAVFWAFTGELSTTVDSIGLVKDNQIICYFDSLDLSENEIGRKASIDAKEKEEILEVESMALSKEEIIGEIGEYAGYTMKIPEWGNRIVISNVSKLEEGSFCKVKITKDKVRPIDFLIH